MRITIFAILVLATVAAMGQAVDSVQTVENDSLWFERGLFVDLGAQYGPAFDIFDSSGMIGLGVKYRKWTLGLTLHEFQHIEGKRIIFPNTFTLRYRYSGLFGGMEIWQWKFLSVQGMLRGGIGDVVWQTDSGENRFRDVNGVVEPYAHVEIVPLKFLRIFGEIGYRQFIGLDIVGASTSDLSGPTFSMGLRLGVFQRIKENTNEDDL